MNVKGIACFEVK